MHKKLVANIPKDLCTHHKYCCCLFHLQWKSDLLKVGAWNTPQVHK